MPGAHIVAHLTVSVLFTFISRPGASSATHYCVSCMSHPRVSSDGCSGERQVPLTSLSIFALAREL